MIIGALEAGGTKMVAPWEEKDGTIIEQVSIPTTTPEETIQRLQHISKIRILRLWGSLRTTRRKSASD